MAAEESSPESRILSLGERKRILANYIATQVNSEGARVESQTDDTAMLVYGQRLNHTLHLILSLLTLGIWLLVWAGLAIFGGEKRRLVRVDDYGNIIY